ncbi:DUF3685 domain-containing protein [Oscillatoria sp. FACHB-1406]|uniref:DUF3685 domain-containing protein n=1 Tax=Oscillatoria sp. FACHB-1406 TaxID=2692846 RepID=UPI001684737B|nr:DUF3685 domain-containing protein [Oscillatoria sp. FACHB-1406]MBD2576140.1 DUF3685 domain-containing protein [Oscillatoria sp. FACHB-1406]
MTQTIDLLLVNEEPLFQQGLSAALRDCPDLRVVSQAIANSPLEALPGVSPRVAAIEGSLSSILQQGEAIARLYPEARRLALCAPPNAQQLHQLRSEGFAGYCPKSSTIEEIVAAIRQIAADRDYWSPAIAVGMPVVSGWPANRFQSWLYASCQTGLDRIDTELEEIAKKLADEHLGTVGWLFWTGRQRELRAARVAIAQFSPGWTIIVPEFSSRSGGETSGALEAVRIGEIVTPDLPSPTAASLFDRASTQIKIGMENRSGQTLEIEILQPEKQRELLYLVLHRTQDIIEKWRFLEIAPEQLPERRVQFFQQVWQSCVLEFIGQYRTAAIVPALPAIALQDSLEIESVTLQKLPLSLDLLTYLLYRAPLIIDRVPYSSETPEAIVRANLLLDNAIIAIANSVVQFLLNNFPEESTLIYNLYQRRYWSSREIARFRNDLSWQYRQNYYIEDPKAIFESRYRLLGFEHNAIRTFNVFASRREELENLQGLRWLATIILEARDAIAPRLRAGIAFLGSGAVYLLTQVLGKAIGLVGRGILQGFGSTLQDNRYGKRTRPDKRS